MAPQIYGQPGEEWGDQRVYDALQFLPDECIVYAQPKLVYKNKVRYPDYVIVYHKWGVVVLEVKDWIEVVGRDRKTARIRHPNRREEIKTSPVEQARQAAHVLEKMLKKDEDLRDYAGRLDFSYAYGGVLPHLPPATIQWLEEEWGETYLLGRDDLRREQITEKIAKIDVPFRTLLSERQVRAICAVIDARNENVDRATGEFKGVYDRIQESIYKEPTVVQPPQTVRREQPVQASFDSELVPSVEARIKHIEAEMPEEAITLKSTAHVRLVRGFAGTGKTDILILRAHYLHEQYPDLDILVTTFNDPLYANRLVPELKDLKPRVDVIKFDTLCASICRKKHGLWSEPQSTEGLVAVMSKDYPLIEELGQSFVADEFIWMKETGRTERQRYVTEVRTGRGSVSGHTFGREMKEPIFDMFEVYQELLRDLPAHDWVDLHEKTRRYLQEGIRPDKQYDVILIDEAQHFAPTWMRIVTEFLKPSGNLFLCDDPSQSVYRYYSWRQKGVEVRGRTRWLRIPYRNTRQIFEAAYALIADNPIAQRLLAEGGEQVQPDLDSTTMREGPQLQVHGFSSWETEREFVMREIATLIHEKGVLPNEIGLLHEKKYVLDRYRSLVPKGVQLYEVKRQTGLEYKAVFIPKVQDMFIRTVGIGWEEDEGRQRLKSYMTMTRARKWLYLLYETNWPKVLEPIRSYVEWIEH